MKKYLTVGNVVVGLLLIGIFIQVIVIFLPKKSKTEDPAVLQQIDGLTQQLQKNDEENKKRDSLLLETFLRNSAAREVSLHKSKQAANEKIENINRPAFNADSIRRAFANN